MKKRIKNSFFYFLEGIKMVYGYIQVVNKIYLDRTADNA